MISSADVPRNRSTKRSCRCPVRSRPRGSVLPSRRGSDGRRFYAERLGPVLAKVLGSESVGKPEVIGINVAHSYLREPVA